MRDKHNSFIASKLGEYVPVLTKANSNAGAFSPSQLGATKKFE
jgi:hypothetical protein